MKFERMNYKKYLMLLLGLLIGIAATAVLVVILAQGLMFRVNESRYGFDETNAMIEARAQELRWGIQHQYDLQASLKKQDFEVDSVRVFSLCKPSLAYQVLNADSERMVSAIMPCRVSVYLRKNGKTYVSRMNGAMMSKFLPKSVRQAMKMAALENEMLLEPILK